MDGFSILLEKSIGLVEESILELNVQYFTINRERPSKSCKMLSTKWWQKKYIKSGKASGN